ncbi:MAG: hypothetical protein CSB48_01300 [Proteobacteria bacterium]|nr:MAG: hypothetical protein CSB48_01300 [Pseudomonadota bacterium]
MAKHSQSIFKELNVGRLPSLPGVLIEMLQACQSGNANFQTISTIVSQDVTISARALSLANSSFYFRGQKITSLERALLVLGTETMKTIVITASIQQFFSSFNSRHNSYLKSMWQQSLTCAMLSRSLAEMTGYPQPEEAYLTGLLHNIGELILDTNYPDDFLAVLDNLKTTQRNQVELENELFLTNHCDIGAWLVDKWQLNEFSSDAIRYHHAPLDKVLDAHHLVKILYAASKFSERDSIDCLENFEATDKLFGLTASLTQEIVVKATEKSADIASSMGVETDTDDDESDIARRAKLAEQIRNLGLLQSSSTLFSEAADLPRLARYIASSAEMLFGFKNSLVFWLSEEAGLLESIATSEHNKSFKLSINLQAGRSIVASAALNRRTLFSCDQQLFRNNLPVIDQQLIRITGSQSIACVPIIVDDSLKGVLVMGTSSPPDNISESDQLIALFASLVGSHISAFKNRQNHDNEAAQSVASALNLAAREIAHEANNPLSIIRNYLEALSNKLSDSANMQNEIDIIREEIERTGQILLRLGDLGGSQEPAQPDKRVDINGEIRSLVNLYQRSMFTTRDIKCTLSLDDRLNKQTTNRNTLRQIMTNLLKNSVEALPAGGSIAIRTTGTVNVNGKNFVEIVISDDGPGIPSDLMRNLFKPVTSTKGKGHSGLGLGITRNLIDQINGSISCRSSNKGTEFQILLPAGGGPG